MKRLALIVALFVTTLIPTLAQAGGGPIERFQDLKRVAQYMIEEHARVMDTGETLDNYESRCEYWNGRISNMLFYFTGESVVRGKEVARKKQNIMKIRLAKATGNPAELAKIPTYRIRRDRATLRLQQIDTWHEMFVTFNSEVAWQQQRFWCSLESPERVCDCEVPNQIMVQELPQSTSVLTGGRQDVFAFVLYNFNQSEASIGADALFEAAQMTIVTNEDDMENVNDCRLMYGDEMVSIGQIDFFEPGVADLSFLFFDYGIVIQPGEGAEFHVSCQIEPPADDQMYLGVGFMPYYGSAPTSSLYVTNMDTNEEMETGPNETLMYGSTY